MLPMSNDLPPHAVIGVFIGLPGAGKSSLARALTRELEGIGFEVHHVEFDAVQREVQQGLEFSATVWREAREICMERVGQAASSACNSTVPTVVLVDDNMFYRSMRKRVLLRARAGRASFMQLYVPATVEQAQSNNLKRPAAQQVHPDVIRTMADKLQPPDCSRNPWEKPTVVWKGSISSPSDLSQLVDSMRRLWGEQLQPHAESEAAHPEGTACHHSLLHELDVATRRLLSQAVSAGDVAGGDIQRLNTLRRQVLQDAKLLAPPELEAAWAALAGGFARAAGLLGCTVTPRS